MALMTAITNQVRRYSVVAAAVLLLGYYPAMALKIAQQPEELINRLTEQVFDQIRSDPEIQSGDQVRVSALVDRVIMPHVDFTKTTALAVGPDWRQASPTQREILAHEFRALLVRTYAGALSEVRDEQVHIKPMRAAPGATDVIVRTEIIGRGEPIELSYRLTRSGDSWRIYDMNVLGFWLVQVYRSQFSSVIRESGIDGLIDTLYRKNKK